MAELKEFLLSYGGILFVLGVVFMTETTKRVVFVRWPSLARQRRQKEGSEVSVMTSGARTWNAVMHLLPSLWGMVIAILPSDLIFSKNVQLGDRLLIAFIIGAWAAVLVKVVLRFVPKQYGDTIDLNQFVTPAEQLYADSLLPAPKQEEPRE